MSSTVNTQTPLEAISCARITVPSEEGRIIPLSPPPRVRKSRSPQPISPQGQGITISIRQGGGPLEENTSHLARGVDLLPEIREEHVAPPALDTAMERKRAHTTPGNEGKGNASVEVLMANSSSQQRRQHQSRSSQASNPSKFFDSVFRFQVDVQKEERYARRSFSEPAVATLRGRGRKGRLEPGNIGRNSNTMAAELPVLDIRRQDKAPRLELDPDVVKPRPFLSHARTGSSLSSSSSRSTVTEESLWPASTSEDARISISSTAYSGSSVMSHSNIYGAALEGGSDRTSFIDLSTTTTTTTKTTKMSNECSPSEGSRARSPKPPIPTTPKPDFGNRSVPNLQQRPPTTNYLKADERADLIRKSRKLAQVFGQTPGAGVMPQQDSWVSFLDLPLGRHLRGTASVSTTPPVWPPPEGTQYLTAYGRRHSTPLTPDRSSCEYMIQVGSQEGEPSTDDQPKGEDTKSFIDLSEEELPDDISAIISNSAPRKDRSPSSSLFQFEHLSPEEQAEELRRRNRDKLAKLHRFLGSRIPADLVLGFEDPSLSLPPPLDVQMDSPDDRKAWLRRRRSSSVAAFPHWSDDHDRVKEDLNDKEKAINVRRAQKMEKMFGVAPPQTLYHTRHGASPSGSLVGLVAPLKSRSAVPGSTPMASPPASPKNMNQSPYKLKSRKDDRTGSSESLTHLLGGDANEDTSSRTRLRGRSGSLVYTHYQHSLNSLVDIIDRDDRESLAELHEYLNSNGNESPSPPLKDFTLTRDRRTSIASIKSERRRSLPTRTSMTSLASEYSISATLASPKPEVTDFQLRRRRAAKLTNFFGVDYRDLIRDVLDSIENGLEHERKRGTINPEEAEVLLQKLREIKTKRDGIF